MPNIKDQILMLSPEELEQKFDQLKEEINLSEPESAQIQQLFEFHYAAELLGMPEEAIQTYEAIKTAIENLLEDETQLAIALDHYLNWVRIAIGFAPDVLTTFPMMEIYRDFVQRFNHVEGDAKVSVMKGRLQMVHHYTTWLSKGGKMENLDQEDVDFLNSSAENLEAEAENLIDQLEESESWVDAISLSRSLGHFFALRKKPNDAIRMIKYVIEILPHHPEYHEADTADEMIELAKVFFAYKKYEVASKYFSEAAEIYSRLGEEMESFQLKAEAWVDECSKMM